MGLVYLESDLVVRGYLRCVSEIAGLPSMAYASSDELLAALERIAAPQAVILGPSLSETERQTLAISIRAQFPCIDIHALTESGEMTDMTWIDEAFVYPFGVDGMLRYFMENYASPLSRRVFKSAACCIPAA